ncbi:MAG: SsrA-binding protein SmpB [Spirochaetaceae bacterium]|jgi:SsrA-binding protein|nr:SsrA-binding protein SmpB [Spirochaetaceae bacterium]
MTEDSKIIALNRKARYDYTIDECYECGIALLGTEVKSFREGKISFPDAWAEIIDGEVWLRSLTVAENPFSSLFNHEPDRKKKLLLHRSEIKRISRNVDEKGYTLIPLSFYFKKGRVKVELALCKGKKAFDKRADIRERDVKRDLARELHQSVIS